METNLKILKGKIDEAINPNAGVGEILAEEHNKVLTETLESTGKYIGFNFNVTKKTTNVVLPGEIVFGNNAINEGSFFILKISNKDKFNLDPGVVIQNLSSSAFLSFKDFNGNASIYEFQSYTSQVDTNGNPYYAVTLKSVTSNSNYAYQEDDLEDCVLNFFYSKNEYGITDFKGWVSPSTVPTEDGWYYADSTGVFSGFNNENVDLSNGISILISKSGQTVFKQIIYPFINIANDGESMNGSEKLFKGKNIAIPINENKKEINTIKGLSIIQGSDSKMTSSNNFIEGLGGLLIDVNSTVANKMYLDFTTGNQAIKLLNVLEIGKKYKLEIVVKINSGAGNQEIQVGSTFTSSASIGILKITPQLVENKYIGEITATSVDFWIGVVSAENNGTKIEIDSIEIFDSEAHSLVKLKADLDSQINKVKGISILQGSDSNMTDANNWITLLGSLVFNINNTVPNRMYIDFTTGNQSIILNNVLTNEKYLWCCYKN